MFITPLYLFMFLVPTSSSSWCFVDVSLIEFSARAEMKTWPRTFHLILMSRLLCHNAQSNFYKLWTLYNLVYLCSFQTLRDFSVSLDFHRQFFHSLIIIALACCLQHISRLFFIIFFNKMTENFNETLFAKRNKKKWEHFR